jgi:hypothetical protein
MASTAFYSNSRIKVIPSFLLHLAYAISRRFFGHQTLGYLHFNIGCDKILFCFVRVSHRYSSVQPYEKELFWQDPQRISTNYSWHRRAIIL